MVAAAQPPTTVTLDTGNLIGTQVFIWVPVMLILILLCSLCMMCDMEVDKNKDTILYAKFVTNIKEK